MSRPKFQSRDAREAAELDLKPCGSEWSIQRVWHQAALTRVRLPDELQPYYDVDTAVRRRLGRLRHRAYLRRTGGNVHTEVDDVHLCWTCCGREELLDEVHYDRHGNLRPEDEARIRGMSYYHHCERW